MPLVPPVAIPLVQAGLTGNAILGVSAPQLALGVSNGFTTYAVSALLASSKDVGAAGSGTGTGFGLFLAEPALIGAMQSTFTANGINGPMRSNLINAIAIGISQSLKAALINTLNVGVGVGTGIVNLVPNTPAAMGLMVTNFVAAGLVGPNSVTLASAIAQGIDLALPSATGVVIIAGAAGPSPGVGTGVGKVT